MTNVTLRLSIADTVNAVRLHYQRYQLARQTKATEAGRILSIKEFDWSSFFSLVISDMVKKPTAYDSPTHREASTQLLLNLGVDAATANSLTSYAFCGIIDQIVVNVPELNTEDLSRCEMDLVEPCDIWLTIPINSFYKRGL